MEFNLAVTADLHAVERCRAAVKEIRNTLLGVRVTVAEQVTHEPPNSACVLSA